MSKKYFYGRRQADLFSFIRIPQLLLTEERFDNLSCEAMVLYGLLLNRMCLSAENGWFDDEGRVFVYWKVDDAAKKIKCHPKKAGKVFKELEEFELIERKRQGLTKPNLIYVLDFSEEVSDGHFQKCQNDISGNVEETSQEVSNEHTNNTKNNKNDFSDTESSHVLSNGEGCDDEGRDRTRLDSDNYSAIRSYVASQISLDALKNDYPDNPLVDALYELIVEVISSNRKEIVISCETRPMSVVKSQFMKLNMFHIVSCLQRMEDARPNVTNIKAYLLTVLYNSIITSDSYIKLKCDYNMYQTNEGGLRNE